MEKFAFVILNYQSTEETVACIESIQKIDYDEKYIIVVDNNSNDEKEFFEYLKQKFGKSEKIVYLKSKQNLGYANGNNIGIDYAKKKIKADFVCVINPDVVIMQKDFVSKSIELFNRYRYTVLGPRIIKNEVDTNPLGGYHESVLRCIRSWIENYRIYFVKKYKLKRYRINRRGKEKSTLLTKYDNSYAISEVGEKTYFLNKGMGLQLSGACLIFSPIFLQNFSGFCKDTFLYCEECIIACAVYNLGYKLLYSTELETMHEGGKSLQNIEKDSDYRQMIISRAGAHSCLVAAKVFLKKNNKLFLRKCLNPICPEYIEG